MPAFVSNSSALIEPDLSKAIVDTPLLLQPGLAGKPIEGGLNLEIRNYEPLLTFLAGNWSQYYVRVRLTDGTELDTINFPSYTPGLGQLGQLSADLVGDRTDLFPAGKRVEVVYELLLPTVRDDDGLRLSLEPGFEWRAYPYFQGVVTQGGDRDNGLAGTTTHIEARSLATSLVGTYLGLSAIANTAQTELITYDSPPQRFDAEINAYVTYLARRVGFGGLIFSQLPVRRLRKVQFTEQSAWGQIQEIANLFNCDAAIDDRFGILRITSVQAEIAAGRVLELSNWDESESEDSPSSPEFSEVMVTGVAPIATNRRVLRSTTPNTAIVPVPTGGSGTTLQLTTVEVVRILDGDRPIRTETTTTVIYPDYPEANEDIRESVRYEYDERGQKIREVRTRVDIGPYDELLPAAEDNFAALVFGGSSEANYWPLSRNGVNANYESVNLDALAVQLRGDRAQTDAVFAVGELSDWQLAGRASLSYSVAGQVSAPKAIAGQAAILTTQDVDAIAAIRGTATLGAAVLGTATQ